jgi:hypothetical protein
VSRVCIILSSPMFTEAAGAFKKCKNQEWPFAGVSGYAARPVVKQPWRDGLAAACECASRARSHAALCVWRRRLPLHFSGWGLQGACHCLACHPSRRRCRCDHRTAVSLCCVVLRTHAHAWPCFRLLLTCMLTVRFAWTRLVPRPHSTSAILEYVLLARSLCCRS